MSAAVPNDSCVTAGSCLVAEFQPRARKQGCNSGSESYCETALDSRCLEALFAFHSFEKSFFGVKFAQLATPAAEQACASLLHLARRVDVLMHQLPDQQRGTLIGILLYSCLDPNQLAALDAELFRRPASMSEATCWTACVTCANAEDTKSIRAQETQQKAQDHSCFGHGSCG